MEPAVTYCSDEPPVPQSDEPWFSIQSRSTLTKSVRSPGLMRGLAMVSKGRELTCKNRRLPSNLASIDRLIGGGLPRGRISEIVGGATSGKTSAATAFAATASRMGETVAWIDSTNSFDPPSHTGAGADLSRILWVNPGSSSSNFSNLAWCDRRNELRRVLRTGELILDTGGFALAIIDLCISPYPLSPGTALRLARMAERSGTAVLMLAERRICGTFAALSLSFSCLGAIFSNSQSAQSSIVISALFDRLTIKTRIIHSKISDGGALGSSANWDAIADPSDHSLSTITAPFDLFTIPAVSSRKSANLR